MECKKCKIEKQESDFPPALKTDNPNFGTCKKCASEVYHLEKEKIGEMREHADHYRILKSYIGEKIKCDKCTLAKSQKEFPLCALATFKADMGYTVSCTTCNSMRVRQGRRKQKEAAILAGEIPPKRNRPPSMARRFIESVANRNSDTWTAESTFIENCRNVIFEVTGHKPTRFNMGRAVKSCIGSSLETDDRNRIRKLVKT